MRFDRFTQRAQDAASRAYQIVQRYRQSQIDTEHLLLALLEQNEGAVAQILEKLGVNASAMAQRVEDTIRAAPKVNVYGGGVEQIFVTPRVRAIVEMAQSEATRLKDEFISTEHIFLAISNERDTNAVLIMQEFGVTREKITEAIQQVQGGTAACLLYTSPSPRDA